MLGRRLRLHMTGRRNKEIYKPILVLRFASCSAACECKQYMCCNKCMEGGRGRGVCAICVCVCVCVCVGLGLGMRVCMCVCMCVSVSGISVSGE